MWFLGTKVIDTKPMSASLKDAIVSCPFYYSCGSLLYVGKCRKDCLDRLKETEDDE